MTKTSSFVISGKTITINVLRNFVVSNVNDEALKGLNVLTSIAERQKGRTWQNSEKNREIKKQQNDYLLNDLSFSSNLSKILYFFFQINIFNVTIRKDSV